MKNLQQMLSDTAQQAGNAIASGAQQAGNAIAAGTRNVVSTVTGALTVENMLTQALNIPGVRIPRSEYLRSALKNYCSDDVVERAIATSPAEAGVDRKIINRLANSAIGLETTKVTGISAAAGIPGGAAMIAATTADIAQYFGFILRILQKLAYLYSFPDFDMGLEEISDSMMNELMWFVAVAFGVDGAAKGIASIARTASAYYTRRVAQRALTKTALYPLTKKIAAQLGYKMTKQVFAKGVSKAVPIVGALASGGITYFSFRTCASHLKNALSTLPTSDPSFYTSAPTPPTPIEVLPSAEYPAATTVTVTPSADAINPGITDPDVIDVPYSIHDPTAPTLPKNDHP